MTRKDYVLWAEIVGRTLAAAYLNGGEAARTVVYDSLYADAVALFAMDNPRFDRLRFAEAVAKAEESFYLDHAEAAAGGQ
jgi:hypothetical protein